jgi:hypothetical protein
MAFNDRGANCEEINPSFDIESSLLFESEAIPLSEKPPPACGFTHRKNFTLTQEFTEMADETKCEALFQMPDGIALSARFAVVGLIGLPGLVWFAGVDRRLRGVRESGLASAWIIAEIIEFNLSKARKSSVLQFNSSFPDSPAGFPSFSARFLFQFLSQFPSAAHPS